MRIEQLRYLVETARSSSINKAGEKLHITQQSLNASLKKLEDELGAALFERNYAGIRLTERGKIAAKYAEAVLDKVDEMQAAVSGLQMCDDEGDLCGELVLYASPASFHSLIPTVMQKLMDKYPNINVTLMEKENSQIVRSMMQGKACACITSVVKTFDKAFDMIDRKKIFYQKIADAKMYVSVAATHPLAHQKSVTGHTLVKYPLGIYQAIDTLDDQFPHAMYSWLSEKGPLNIHIKTNNLRACQRAIDEGQCVGFVPKIMFGREAIDVREGIIYLPVRDFPTFETVCTMNWDYYYDNQELVMALMECIEEAMDQ
ncbi:MAG: LysR family transcriptional regulator [Peptococcaceae bacterium]|nr:LysR family transcriptional regulator [Peptococcaceae bacterium]